jgi:hypothetical protein
VRFIFSHQVHEIPLVEEEMHRTEFIDPSSISLLSGRMSPQSLKSIEFVLVSGSVVRNVVAAENPNVSNLVLEI